MTDKQKLIEAMECSARGGMQCLSIDCPYNSLEMCDREQIILDARKQIIFDALALKLLKHIYLQMQHGTEISDSRSIKTNESNKSMC